MGTEPRYLKLGDIEAYRISFALSNVVWRQVASCEQLAQRTVGKQFVRATDSISANIAEGFGRFSKKDKVRFYRIARGSLFEALDWNEKAKVRGLVTPAQYMQVYTELQRLPKAINSPIKFTNERLKI
ncbi:four helix bundle protein [Hymenobacter sp. PAMC 26628]|nr:four helix bundle protein [Hymenobacter sp. PAMC 26628]